MTSALTKVLHLLSIVALMQFAVVTPADAAHHVMSDSVQLISTEGSHCSEHAAQTASDKVGKSGDQQPTKEKSCCAAHCASHSHASLRSDATVAIDWTKSPALKPSAFAFGPGLTLDTPKRPPRA